MVEAKLQSLADHAAPLTEVRPKQVEERTTSLAEVVNSPVKELPEVVGQAHIDAVVVRIAGQPTYMDSGFEEIQTHRQVEFKVLEETLRDSLEKLQVSTERDAE